MPIWGIPSILRSTVASMPPGPARTFMEGRVEHASTLASYVSTSGSFMHVHMAIPVRDDDPTDLECHHSVIMDWSRPVDDPQNMVIVSVPSVFQPVEGYHVIHAYTAASDDFDEWSGFLSKDASGARDRAAGTDGEFDDPNCYKSSYSDEGGYEALKTERGDVLFRALERISIPDIRSRAAEPEAGEFEARNESAPPFVSIFLPNPAAVHARLQPPPPPPPPPPPTPPGPCFLQS